ncbi:hypothetical protein HZH68_010454 [Vespula germanica]|uniref:Odorant receptor n=1 Tax=Vespula germanica TaxID=30212 RepID=A0A834N2Q7_VESGE|nr:hypothetical protein HZH68_010454 [Vespula germanica]
MMDFFDGRHYTINKGTLSLLGQWPYQSIRKKYIGLVILFLLTGTQIIAKICAIITSFNDINVVLDDMASLIADFTAIIKLINVSVQRKKMKVLLNRMKTDYALFTTDGEMEIMVEYAEKGRKFTIVYIGIFFVSMLQFMIPPLKSIILSSMNGTSERPLIHHVEYFVDPQKYYYLIIFQSYAIIFICAFTIATMDTIFVVFVQHACGLFTTLGYQLRRIVDNNVLSINLYPLKSNDKFYKNISECVRRHQEAIQFAILNVNETKQFFQQICVCCTTLFIILFQCVNGQRLIDHSDRMHEHLINTEWYQTSLRARNGIYLMLIRSRKPCMLTAAKMFNVSMETFSSVLNLEKIGRKICSDLRNLQKERIILFREAKCLLREFERQETQRDHSKNKKDDNKACSCAVWENDLKIEDENETEESTKLITQDDESYKNFCDECCQHCVPRHDDNIIYKCSSYRYDKFDEPFYCNHPVRNIDYSGIGDNVTIKDDANGDNNLNNANELIRYCETCAINPSYLYDLCLFCENDNMNDTHVLSTNHKVDVNESKKAGMKEIKRQRGGGGKSDSESIIEKLSNLSICTCDCDLCALRNKYGEKSPCLKKSDENDCFSDIDTEDNLLLNQAAYLELPEISQYCKIDKLREALEKLKNRNHTLRKLLKSQECLMKNAKCTHCSLLLKQYDDMDCEKESQTHRDNGKKVTNDLIAMVKILQSKCRIKDGMIVALADELKGFDKSERIQRVLQKLTEIDLDCQIIDFDRTTLWKYLRHLSLNTGTSKYLL